MRADDSAGGIPAVVLLSGGLDSMVVAALASERGHAIHALSVDYGQRHRRELDAARAIAERLKVARHVVLPLDLTVEVPCTAVGQLPDGREDGVLVSTAPREAGENAAARALMVSVAGPDVEVRSRNEIGRAHV